MTVKVIEAEITCGGAPFQVECKLEDGRFMYIRWEGWMEIGVGGCPENALSMLDLPSGTFYEGWHQCKGYGSMEELIDATKDKIDWSSVNVR